MRQGTVAWMLFGFMIGTFPLSVMGLAQTPCPIEPIKLSRTGATLNDLNIELSGGTILGDPNGPDHAMVWDEPMTLRQRSGTHCSVDPKVAIITAPFFDAGGHVLYVTTYSGSHSVLFAVNAENCKVLWESRPFKKGPNLVGQKFVFSNTSPVTIGSDCLPTHPDAK
jgi:outer membrane protein assembly factor BamB